MGFWDNIFGKTGESGYSGWSGQSGYSGWSGIGLSGPSGPRGFIGQTGEDGQSGYSGWSGFSGWSGISGYVGLSGFSGWSGHYGKPGLDGMMGLSGWSGWSGQMGPSGKGFPETIYRTMVLGAGGWPSIVDGCNAQSKSDTIANNNTYLTLEFPNGKQTHAEWTTVMPENYDGNPLIATFYWFADEGVTGDTVSWGIQCASVANEGMLDSPFGLVASSTGTFSSGGKLMLTISEELPLSGIPTGNLLQFRVFRRGDDTLNYAAKLLLVKIKYSTREYSE